MAQKITPFLMFEGKAQAAMDFYTSLFSDGTVTDVEKYGADDGGPEGTIKRATFMIAGQDFFCSDSPIAHDFTFTPSMSIFVDCESETELNRLFEKLSSDGQVMMPPDNYGFSKKFAWTADRFGVSWQLNLQ